MPYEKLTNKIKVFSKLRIKQLFDDLRIRAAWYSDVSRGKQIFSKQLRRNITLEDIIDQFAKIRGLLIALGYPLKPAARKKATFLTSELYKRAMPKILKYFKAYKGKVKRG